MPLFFGGFAARGVGRANGRGGRGQQRGRRFGIQAGVAVHRAHCIRGPQAVPGRLPQPLQGASANSIRFGALCLALY